MNFFCIVSDDLGYVIYSALGSFYIPSCIMIFVYIRIYYAAKARARRGVPKKKPSTTGVGDRSTTMHKAATKPNSVATSTSVPQNTTTTTSFTKASSSPMAVLGSDNSRNGATTERTGLLNKKVFISDVRVHEEEPGSGSDTPIMNPDYEAPLRTVSEQVDAGHRNHSLKSENGLYIGPMATGNPDMKIGLPPPSSPPTSLREPNGENMAIAVASPANSLRRGIPANSMDGDQMSDIDPSSSDSGVVTRCSVVKPLRLRFCHPLLGKKLTKPKRELIDMGRVSTPKALEPEKEKRRLARKKEKRATLILGLIMGSFIACWFPFFFMYILGPMCPACHIPVYAFDLAFWLGYMNSAFNPVIYTIFNKDFRRAFRKILFK
ncbi:alpha-2B adrenergic receptor [Palaemon carinicauda]|uniref:alpha-2B adrenergic receptor n=1 Tax=Palaemon carinicauda TaxID=392227 RepID=UPI0035B677EE